MPLAFFVRVWYNQSMNYYTDIKKYGNSILYRGHDSQGNRIQKRIKFKPNLYIPVQSGKNHVSGWRSFDGVPVEPVELESMKEAKAFMDKYNDVQGFNVYGNTNYVSQYMQRVWPQEIHFNSKDIRIGNFDIEVATSSPKYSDNHKIKVRLKPK